MKNIRVSLYAAGGSLFGSLIYEGMQTFLQLSPHEQLRRLVVMIISLVGTAIFIDHFLDWVTGSRSEHAKPTIAHRHSSRYKLIALMIVLMANFFEEILDGVVDQAITGPLSIFNKVLVPVVCTAAITSAWIYGVRNGRKRAKRYGLFTGLVVAFAFFVVVIGDMYFSLTPDQSWGTHAERLLVVSTVAIELLWWIAIPFPIVGFLGGLAVDRRWCGKAWIGIAVGLVMSAVVDTTVIFCSFSLEAIAAHRSFPLEIRPFLLSGIFSSLFWPIGLGLCKEADTALRPASGRLTRAHGLIGEIGSGALASLEAFGVGLLLFVLALKIGTSLQYRILGPGYVTSRSLHATARPTEGTMLGRNAHSEKH
jgi:hypothetical protein